MRWGVCSGSRGSRESGGKREVTEGNSRKGRSGSKAREVSEGMVTLFYFFPLCWFLIWEYIRYGCFAFILGNFFICWATRAVFIGAGDVVNSTKGGEKVIGDPERDERQYEGWDRSR